MVVVVALIDITLTEGATGKMLMHRPDCPMVQKHREDGLPIVTLYGIKELPREVDKHACLVERR